jgi:hypothetical protein
MQQRRSSERPQRVLQPLGQCHEALAAEHDMGMFPAREGQPEVIEPMIERRAGDADAATTHVGEVGQPEPARRMLLPKDDVLLDPVQRPPSPDAALQGTPDASADLRMAASDLVENRDGPQTRGALQQRNHLAVPDRGNRISPPPLARRFLL